MASRAGVPCHSYGDREYARNRFFYQRVEALSSGTWSNTPAEVKSWNEPKEALSKMGEDKERNTSLEENCERVSFKMNSPSASHMGSSWERQIRTVRSVLASLFEEAGHQLDNESFHTLLKEVQEVVNSRPLALNGMSSADSPEPLRPNHLLTTKSKVLLPPPGVFLREDVYLRRRWRRVQDLANVF